MTNSLTLVDIADSASDDEKLLTSTNSLTVRDHHLKIQFFVTLLTTKSLCKYIDENRPEKFRKYDIKIALITKFPKSGLPFLYDVWL